MAFADHDRVDKQHKQCEAQEVSDTRKRNDPHAEVTKLLAKAEPFEQFTKTKQRSELSDKDGDATKKHAQHECNGCISCHHGRQHAGRTECCSCHPIARVGCRDQAPVGISQKGQYENMA